MLSDVVAMIALAAADPQTAPPPLPLQPSIPAPDDARPCSLSLDVRGEVAWRGLYGRGYESASPVAYEPAMVSVRHDGAPCAYFVVVTGDGQLTGSGGSLSYDVLDAPSGRSVVSSDPLGSAGRRIGGTFRTGEDVAQVPVFVSLPPSQPARSGTYSGISRISLYRDGVVPELIQEAPLGVSVPVQPVLSVSSSLASRSSSLDLGFIDKGAQASVDFTVVSNVRVAGRIESSGKGTLVHQSGVSSIPYRLTFGGRRVELSVGSAVERFDVVPGSPASLPLIISVESVPGALAGRYSDTLTVTFSSEG